jgi:hypothetical protein
MKNNVLFGSILSVFILFSLIIRPNVAKELVNHDSTRNPLKWRLVIYFE